MTAPFERIVENGAELEVTAADAAALASVSLIYRCEDPDCGGVYHLNSVAPDLHALEVFRHITQWIAEEAHV